MAIHLRAEDNGLTDSDVTGPTMVTVACFLTVAFYNVVELTILIAITFKRRKGLYFLSMIAATSGIALNGTGYLLKFVGAQDSCAARTLYTVLVLLGWCTMVTGQSMVLFSRLHLVVHDRRIIKLVLGMILVDATICHPPIFALFALANSANPGPYANAYSIYEKFQLVVFFTQELIMSLIYIKQSAKFLQSRKEITRTSSSKKGRAAAVNSSNAVMHWLIAVNFLVVFLDVSILALEFADFYDLQTSWVSTSVRAGLNV